LLLAWAGCTPISSGGSNDNKSGTVYRLDLPAGFPNPTIPDDNPLTVEKVDLGRYLFYDPRLSGNGEQSCSSCHVQEHAFAEPLVTSIGSTGEHTARNAPGLGNIAYFSTYTWSSQLLVKIEQQMLLPMFGENPIELGITGNVRKATIRTALTT
jgi:cytochrome c peroxidase